ncbi:MAG: biliverdin-producing heme oxygenase [Planctomycetota bacterium]
MRTVLRQLTQEAHQRAEAVFPLRRIVSGRPGYAEWLGTQAIWYQCVSQQLARCLGDQTEHAIERFVASIDRRRLALEADCEAIGVVGGASHLVRVERVALDRSSAAAAGACYVVLGSAMGAALIRKAVVEHGRGDWPMAFFTLLSKEHEKRVWPSFLDYLSGFESADDERAGGQAAEWAFGQFAEIAWSYAGPTVPRAAVDPGGVAE